MEMLEYLENTDPFLEIGLGEASILLSHPQAYGPSYDLVVDAWGVQIDYKGDDYYHCGFSKLKFKGVIRVEVKLTLYDDSGAFVKVNNENFTQGFEFGNKDVSDCFLYEIETSLIFPKAFGCIKIWGSKGMDKEFNPSALVPMFDYIKEPNKYSY